MPLRGPVAYLTYGVGRTLLRHDDSSNHSWQVAYNFGTMSSIAFWIGVTIFGLGAIFGLLSAIRTLQISRRWSNYRLRQRYIVQARGSVLLALLSGSLALALLILARSARPTSAPAALPVTASSTAQATASPSPQVPPTETAIATVVSPTHTPITPSPVVIPTTTQATATPVMPIAVQAMIQGTVTPAVRRGIRPAAFLHRDQQLHPGGAGRQVQQSH